MPVELALPQGCETPVTARQHANFGYRYAYARSADSRAHDDVGQDFLALRADERVLAFALCDGVSQSFFGDLAARILGEALVQWFWENVTSLLKSSDGALRSALGEFLDSLVAPASQQVARISVPDHLPPMVREVLEEKRGLGSESTFVAGRLDLRTNRLYLAWMGDSRLRLWDEQGEITAKLGQTFHTAERWSTRRGRIGNLHVAVIPLAALRYLIAYSDGLARLDRAMSRHLRDESIQAAIDFAGRRPDSDDVSYFEVWLGGRRPPEGRPLSAPRALRLTTSDEGLHLTWQGVPQARWYEVQLEQGEAFEVSAPQTSLLLPARHAPNDRVRVRAWAEEVGEWSAFLDLPTVLPIVGMRERDSVPATQPPLPGPKTAISPTLTRHPLRLVIASSIVALLVIALAGVAALALAQPGLLSPTPTPMPTPTPYPTYTPLPTYTLSPTPSPYPTYTPYPTLTPYFTYTPYPTYTPLPSPTSLVSYIPTIAAAPDEMTPTIGANQAVPTVTLTPLLSPTP
jgi:hypothetical protein